MEEVSVVLINLPVGLSSAFFLSTAPSAFTGLCKVPFLSSTTGGAGGGGAFNTFEGVLIISRIANASASATALLALIDFKASSAASFSSTTGFDEISGTLATSEVAFTESLLCDSSNFLLASSTASLAACCFIFFSSFAACNSASCRANNSA